MLRFAEEEIQIHRHFFPTKQSNSLMFDLDLETIDFFL